MINKKDFLKNKYKVKKKKKSHLTLKFLTEEKEIEDLNLVPGEVVENP